MGGFAKHMDIPLLVQCFVFFNQYDSKQCVHLTALYPILRNARNNNNNNNNNNNCVSLSPQANYK
jgi:hypothetical protein